MPCPDYRRCYDPEWCRQGGPCDEAKAAHEKVMRIAREQIERWSGALKILGDR